MNVRKRGRRYAVGIYDPERIGTIGAGKNRPTGFVGVAMVQSLARHEGLTRLVAGYGHVAVDECHQVPAVTTERILRTAPARYVTGLSATPHRRDGHHPIITMQCGPVRHTIDTHATRSQTPLRLRVVRRDTAFDPSTLPTEPSIQEIYGAPATDESRTELIACDALELTEQGRSLIVLTERRKHLDRLRAVFRTGFRCLSHCVATCSPRRVALRSRKWQRRPTASRELCWQRGATSAKVSTIPDSTRSSSRCRSLGRGRSSNTRAACTVSTRQARGARVRLRRCRAPGASAQCSPSASRPTAHSATSCRPMLPDPRLASSTDVLVLGGPGPAAARRRQGVRHADRGRPQLERWLQPPGDPDLPGQRQRPDRELARPVGQTRPTPRRVRFAETLAASAPSTRPLVGRTRGAQANRT
jgi:hypothetical protein